MQREADRMTEKAQRASERSRELGQAAKKRSVELGRSTRQSVAQLDVRWAHGPLGHAIREATGRFVLTPLMNLYTRRRVVGRERLKGLKPPIVLVANHASHMDTPAILRALPRRWRRRTVVAAATDYFYRSKVVATLVSVFFNAVPIERGGGGLSPRTTAHIDRHLKRRHNLLLYPEGTRSRQGRVGQLRPGAAVIATKHRASIVPIHVSGTHAAMPPGRRWPKRIRRGLLSRRHEVTITFGTPITPDSDGDRAAVMEGVSSFFQQAGRAVAQQQPGDRARAWLRRRQRRRRWGWIGGGHGLPQAARRRRRRASGRLLGR